jgi:hypothetical protein
MTSQNTRTREGVTIIPSFRSMMKISSGENPAARAAAIRFFRAMSSSRFCVFIILELFVLLFSAKFEAQRRLQVQANNPNISGANEICLPQRGHRASTEPTVQADDSQVSASLPSRGGNWQAS